MTSSPPLRFQHDPRKLVDCLSERAKRWWGATAVIKVCSVSLGAISVLLFPGFKSAAVIIFLLFIAAELAAWRSVVEPAFVATNGPHYSRRYYGTNCDVRSRFADKY